MAYRAVLLFAALALPATVLCAPTIWPANNPVEKLTVPGGTYTPQGTCTKQFLVGYFDVIVMSYKQECQVSGAAVIVQTDGSSSLEKFHDLSGTHDEEESTCSFTVAGRNFVIKEDGSTSASDDCKQKAFKTMPNDPDHPLEFKNWYNIKDRLVGGLRVKQQRSGKMKVWASAVIKAQGSNDPWVSKVGHYLSTFTAVAGKGKMGKQTYSDFNKQRDENPAMWWLSFKARNNKKKFQRSIFVQNRASASNGGDVVVTEVRNGLAISVANDDMKDPVAYLRLREISNSIYADKEVKDWFGGEKQPKDTNKRRRRRQKPRKNKFKLPH